MVRISLLLSSKFQNTFNNYFEADGEPVSCCSEDGSSVLPPQMLHYACQPIEIEPEDEFYSHFNQGCINFVRSALSVDHECKLGYGKQVLFHNTNSVLLEPN